MPRWTLASVRTDVYLAGMRSPFAPVIVPAAALIASLVRWWLQGSGNLYTALDKRFYIPDPVTGWRLSVQHPIWLGLEVCAIIAVIACGVAGAGWWIRRRERTTGAPRTVLRIATWGVAVLPLAVPLLAFASGAGPANGVDLLPAKAAIAIEGGIEGSLALPAGRYEVVANRATSITAKLKAGGEAFDALFTGDVRGTWTGAPKDLKTLMTAEVSVATASVNTGIDERSKHARESYLLSDKYPRLVFRLAQVLASRQDGPASVQFRARGSVELIGRTHAVEVTGTLTQLDAAAQQHLGVTGAALLVDASFTLSIKETALAPDAGDFNGDQIPVLVSLVLRHTSG